MHLISSALTHVHLYESSLARFHGGYKHLKSLRLQNKGFFPVGLVAWPVLRGCSTLLPLPGWRGQPPCAKEQSSRMKGAAAERCSWQRERANSNCSEPTQLAVDQATTALQDGTVLPPSWQVSGYWGRRHHPH